MKLRYGVVVMALAAPGAALGAEPVLVNGSFLEWADGRPVGWEVSIGATSGEGRKSSIEPLEGGGLALQGDIAVGAWRYVSQSFAVRPGTTYRIGFEARAEDLTRGPEQFESCYVSLTLEDAAGRELSRQNLDVHDPRWLRRLLAARAPEGAAQAEVGIFLAMTGRIEVRGFDVAADPRSSFETLVQDLGRHYPGLARRGVDWNALAEAHRERGEQAVWPEEFAAVAQEMLSQLRDVEVSFEMPDGSRRVPYRETVKANLDFPAVAKRLQNIRQASRLWLTGRAPQGYGYVAVWSLSATPQDFDALERAMRPLMGAPAMILDLRGVARGDEASALRVASLFADRRRVWGLARVRSGPDPADFLEEPEWTVEPREGGTYTGPVACLIGPGTLGAGELLAMMMKAMPHVVLMGQPTRGACGGPEPLALPIGVTVQYPRRIPILPDGTVVDGRGVAPDVPVEHEGPGDPTFEAALRDLAARIEGSPAAAD